MKKILLSSSAWILSASLCLAQNDIASGVAALDGLTSDLQLYLNPVTKVVYVIAAILGIIGAVRVYSNMQAGKENVWGSASMWFGSCLFLLIANTLLTGFFL